MNISFQCLGLVLVGAMSLYYRYENRQRDRVEGGPRPKGEILDVQEQYDKAIGQLDPFDDLAIAHVA